MQGLPRQILPKSTKVEAFVEKKSSVKTDAGSFIEGDQQVDSSKGDSSGFASLLSKITGKAGVEGKSGRKVDGKADSKESEVKSELGETLKNLLAEKNKIKADGADGDTKTLAAATNSAVQSNEKANILGKVATNNSDELLDNKLDKKIANTSNNLDQLLNRLKNSDQSSEVEENNESVKVEKSQNHQDLRLKKTDSKLESPLDFLMNASKNKNVSETKNIETSKELEKSALPRNVMTGEDYIKNLESTEKKIPVKLALLNNLSDIQKNTPQNVKGYGQGLSLLSDPLIKNTNDLTSKDTKKQSLIGGVDELKNPETKIGAELASIKQDVIPGIQNVKNNHGQPADTQAQASQKVLDLSKIDTANTNEIIKRISDYVEQNQVANKSSLDLVVKHESLGEFKIQVSKMPNQPASMGQNLIDMQITTSNKEGHDFFLKNEVSLMKNLSQAGIQLSDLRIISSMTESTPFGQSDSKQSSSFSQNPDGTDKKFMNFESNNFSSQTSGDSGNGSQRRKELWEEYQQRYGA
jgi:hypothetical protein